MRPSELLVQMTKQTGLYNIQAIENIPSIMKYGLLSNEKAKHIKHASIAMQEVQDIRNDVCVPNGLKLHQYANVYFDPRNPMLSAKRDVNEEICILKFDRVIIDMHGVVVSDMNASSAYATFYPPEEGLRRIDFGLVFANYWTDDNYFEYRRKKSIKCAEVLVPREIPYKYVISAAVISSVAKERLADLGFDRPIEVCPKIFF